MATPHSADRLVGGWLTFLCDADGAAAHPHPQRIHACIYQVLCLGSCYHCNRQREPETVNTKNLRIYPECHLSCLDTLQLRSIIDQIFLIVVSGALFSRLTIQRIVLNHKSRSKYGAPEGILGERKNWWVILLRDLFLFSKCASRPVTTNMEHTHYPQDYFKLYFQMGLTHKDI